MNLAEIANAKTLCILLVEGVEGISNLDEILTVDGIDVIYIGTYDLCQSVGHPGQPNHPEVVKLLSTCVRKINSAGKLEIKANILDLKKGILEANAVTKFKGLKTSEGKFKFIDPKFFKSFIWPHFTINMDNSSTSF